MVYKRKLPMQNKQWTRQCMDIQQLLSKGILSSEVANSTTTTNPDESTETNSSTTKYYVYLITEDPTQSADGYKAGSLKTSGAIS